MASRPVIHRARGLARREALLRAAVEIVAERGVGGATHRAIAQRAGVPASTTTYFFASIDELIVEALRHFTAERVEQLEQLAAFLTANKSDPRETATLFAEILGGVPINASVAQFEAYLEATRRNSDERAAVALIVGAFDRVAVAALRTADTPNAELIAPIFVALADGFALRRLATGQSHDAALLADAYHRLFVSYAETPVALTPPASDADAVAAG